MRQELPPWHAAYPQSYGLAVAVLVVNFFNIAAVHRQDCSGFVCPDDHVLRASPADLECKSDVCAPSDAYVCCEEKGKCVEVDCPGGFTLKDKSWQLHCSAPKCNVDVDTEACCDALASCSSMQCPEGFVAKDNAAEIACQASKCQVSDTGACCDQAARCSSFDCPAGFLPQPKSWELACSSQECTKADVQTCCIDKASCAGFTCPAGKALMNKAETLKCKGSECTDDDASTCCGDARMCNIFTCPNSTQLRNGAADISCTTAGCSDADKSICCEALAPCSSMKCPAGFSHKDHADNRTCNSTKCDSQLSQDVASCCDALQECSMVECPQGYAQRQDQMRHFCRGRQCQESDTAMCCELLGCCYAYDLDKDDKPCCLLALKQMTHSSCWALRSGRGTNASMENQSYAGFEAGDACPSSPAQAHDWLQQRPATSSRSASPVWLSAVPWLLGLLTLGILVAVSLLIVCLNEMEQGELEELCPMLRRTGFNRVEPQP
mmetsp:Transcript_33345/g.61139  ORF Transcript_33345/g.61139 Transcript_33345/m.61139 type:complete len:494 (+) Transcript_33345:61-1542(+)